jgi:hypothetical protein
VATGPGGVRLAPGSLAHRLLGDQVSVPSYHHQGLASAGSLTVTGWVVNRGRSKTVRVALTLVAEPLALETTTL